MYHDAVYFIYMDFSFGMGKEVKLTEGKKGQCWFKAHLCCVFVAKLILFSTLLAVKKRKLLID